MPCLGSSLHRYWARLCAALPIICAIQAHANEPVICPSSTTGLTHPPSSPASESRFDLSLPFNITSDAATLGAEGDTTVEGNVQVLQGDRKLRANHAHYDPAHKTLEVEGGVEYTDSLVHVTGGGGSYTQDVGAQFNGAQFELHQPPARGSADVMHLTPDGKIRFDHVRFTTCPKEDRAWQLRAKEIILDTRARIGTAKHTKIDFKDVPILYLPYLSFPLSSDRKSGFLFPTIGNSSTNGLQLSVPYYWNIAPNMDATIEPTEYQKRGLDLGGDFRYLTSSQHGEFTFDFLPDDRLDNNQDRNHVKLLHVSELPDDWRFTLNAESVSDQEYFQDFSQGTAGTSTAFLERDAMLSYRDENWRLSGELQQFQTLVPTLILPYVDRPYAEAPRLVADGHFAMGPAEQLQYGFDSELVDFTRPIGVRGWRFDMLPQVSLNLAEPGYFVRPGLAWRFTQYALQDLPSRPCALYDLTCLHVATADEAPTRELPTASFDTGLIFERESGSGGSRILTLEPRVLFVYTPYRPQDELPLFDTALPDLNMVELFRTNRYVGADRVGDADQVSVGATSRLIDAKDGTQYLAASLGQIYYFKAPRVLLPDEEPVSTNSDMVAQVALTAYKHWSSNIDVEWDPHTFAGERAEVSVQYHPAPEQVLNLTYRMQRDRLKQLEGSGAWPIGAHWSLYGRAVYSLLDQKMLDRFAGFEYGACCWKIRLVGRRYLNTPTGNQETGVYVQLELTGLASVGSAADALLTEAIPGFKPQQLQH